MYENKTKIFVQKTRADKKEQVENILGQKMKIASENFRMNTFILKT